MPALVSGKDPLAVGKQELHWVKEEPTNNKQKNNKHNQTNKTNN